MTAEFKKNNQISPPIERPQSPNSTKPAGISRKPECQKKHITNDGKRKRQLVNNRF